MQVLSELVATGREREGVLFTSPHRSAPYSYRDFCTNVWKGGNLMRHYGVREGMAVAVVVGPKNPTAGDEPGYLRDCPDGLLAILAATLDGAVADLAPGPEVDATALVAPAAWLDRYELAPGTKAIAYGGPSDDPTVAGFERELWSENPLQPPGERAPDDPALRDADGSYTHGEVLAASERVVEEYDVDAETTLAFRASVTSAGAVVAGLLAPLRAGATVRFGDSAASDVAVAGQGDDVPEKRVVRPDAISV
ncbi:hypothetical protein [Haloarcula onubensis]|uniref:Acetyl-CoA synthetase n=1 Tax=Haloarcula onubensis TaxID=2950539 RepID=A0ABU2FLZ9_9EURY|nr:hypothetical protein [Halomicroarcula sp. S3CR25-11]MDS0281257.1 hypothetical protein [Halomicroarcula sp. S3CR25-11]